MLTYTEFDSADLLAIVTSFVLKGSVIFLFRFRDTLWSEVDLIVANQEVIL